MAKILGTALLFAVFCLQLGLSQQNEAGVNVDRRIDSLLLADPDGFGLAVDTLPPGGIPPSSPLPSVDSRAPAISDLVRNDARRTLPSYTRAEGLVLYLGNADPAMVISTRSFRLGVSADGGFAFSANTWEWRFRIENEFLDASMPVRCTVEAHDVIDSRENWKCSDLENSLAAVIAGLEARDFYAERRGVAADVVLFPAPSIAVGATWMYDEYGEARRRVEWSIFGPPQPFAEVPLGYVGLLRSITPRIAVGTFGDGSGDGHGVNFGLDARMEFGRTEGTSFQQAVVDGRIRFWPLRGELSFAGHARVVVSEGSIPPQRLTALGGFGSIASHPLNAYRMETGSLWTFEALIRPFRDSRSRLLQDLSLVIGGEWCVLEQVDRPAETHGGLGIYISTATGTMRSGIAIPTDGGFNPRLAVRLERPF